MGAGEGPTKQQEASAAAGLAFVQRAMRAVCEGPIGRGMRAGAGAAGAWALGSVHVCARVCVRARAHACVHVCVRAFVCVYVCVCACARVHPCAEPGQGCAHLWGSAVGCAACGCHGRLGPATALGHITGTASWSCLAHSSSAPLHSHIPLVALALAAATGDGRSLESGAHAAVHCSCPRSRPAAQPHLAGGPGSCGCHG